MGLAVIYNSLVLIGVLYKLSNTLQFILFDIPLENYSLALSLDVTNILLVNYGSLCVNLYRHFLAFSICQFHNSVHGLVFHISLFKSEKWFHNRQGEDLVVCFSLSLANS